MKSRRRCTIVVLAALACLMATRSCNVSPVPGRFTYIVKYEVTGTSGTDATVQYMDETTGLLSVPATLAASPWSEERSCTYLDNNPYDPELQVNALTVNPGDTITFRVIVKDYKTNFQEEVLASLEIENTGGPLPTTPFSIYGEQLPK